MSDRYIDLDRIHQLKEKGVLSEREYEIEKARLLQPQFQEVTKDVLKAAKHSLDHQVWPVVTLTAKFVYLGLLAVISVVLLVALLD